MMRKLNLPAFDYRLRKKGEKTYIFDGLRKKYVLLTAEEWVRQHCINYLIFYRHFPPSLMVVEKRIGRQQKRFDILVYGTNYRPLVLVECKAATATLGEGVLNQVVAYNPQCIPYLLFTNGRKHFFFKFEPEGKKYRQLPTIPAFEEINPR